MKHLLLTLGIAVAFIPCVTLAQNLESLGGQSDSLVIETAPLRPGPNQMVTITIESYATDLNRSTVSWFLNNGLAKEGIGQKQFTFKTGKTGSLSNILIVVTTQEGALIQETLNIRPASLDLIWEAQSYTPPFYKGKAFYPYQGTVKVVAIPNIVTENGGKLSAKNLVYTWTINGSVNQAVSGYGKNFINFIGGIPLKPTEVEVEAESIDKVYVASGLTSFTPQPPELLFYEDNPLYGILYNKALAGEVMLRDEEIRIAAIPYFIGVGQRTGAGLTYNWQLNSESAGVDTANDSLTFRRDKGVTGTALVSLEVANPAKIFQFSKNNLSLDFTNIVTTNLH